MKIKLSDYQKNKIMKNLKNEQGCTIRLEPSQIGVGKEYPLTNKQTEVLKEGKKKGKNVQLILPVTQLKTGGFLPLLFAGLGAAGALMGGGAAIANVIIDKKDKDKIRAETQRHNEAMERIIAEKVSTVHVGSNLRKKKRKRALSKKV